ncbi:MAG: 4-hydroxy-tetrahydrodipicolinate reductase, partial [Eubacterium sp.]
MTDILLIGCNGKMGKVITDVVLHRDDCKIVAGVDLYDAPNNIYPIYKDLDDCKEKADVIIDFSGITDYEKRLDYAVNNSIPIVIGTTGFTDEMKKVIEKASE